MRTESAYIFNCAECGAHTESHLPEGVCPGCGRLFEIASGDRPTTPGFCCVITEDMELGSAMLIAESPSWGRGYRPCGPVISVNEAVEIADSMKLPFDADLVVWATGRDGYMAIAAHLFRDEKTGRYRAQICS